MERMEDKPFGAMVERIAPYDLTLTNAVSRANYRKSGLGPDA